MYSASIFEAGVEYKQGKRSQKHIQQELKHRVDSESHSKGVMIGGLRGMNW